MQKITREALNNKCVELLDSGKVTRVLAWGKGEFGYDVTPTIFKDKESLEKGFVFGDFCGANFA